MREMEKPFITSTVLIGRNSFDNAAEYHYYDCNLTIHDDTMNQYFWTLLKRFFWT